MPPFCEDSEEEQVECINAEIRSYELEVINVKAKDVQLRMPRKWNDSNGNRLD